MRDRKTWLILSAALLVLMPVAHAAVSISPSSVQLNPGASVQFIASGSNFVIWSLSGAGCSGIGCGTISYNGYYTAPLMPPSPATVTVSAISIFDTTQTATATVTIGAPTVAVAVSPGSVTLAPNGTQQFSAQVTGTSNTGVTWSVSGAGCSGAACGAITSSGFYTAPATAPSPAVVTIAAMSVADTSKSGTATVTIQSAPAVSVSVSPSTAQVTAGTEQQFTATVTGTTNTTVTWALSGAGCSGASCGSISSVGLYTAPANVPSPAKVTVTATSVASSSASGSATVTVVASPTLTVTPASPQVKPHGQVQFAASGTGSGVVVWSLTGAGCSGSQCGVISAGGLYTAPGLAPTPDSVTVTANSVTNPGVAGSTTLSISPSGVSVSLSPAAASVGTSAQQQFTVTVTGSTNTAVVWTLTGAGCSGNTCGTISGSGLYVAPATLPVPPFVTVTATSVADPTESASAGITLTGNMGITITPTTAQVPEQQTLQFSATVTGSVNTGVLWSVSGSGCEGSGCGTISTNGLYTAPDTIPGLVTVTATSAANHAISASASITIVSPVLVTVLPASVIVAVDTQQTFVATVTGSDNPAVTWSVSGSGCSGNACGTITSAGVYTAPLTLPSSATVTITATSQGPSSGSGTATVSLVASNNGKLSGPYAFSFTGYDGSGSYLIAGAFTADGDGNIVSGEEDVNSMSGAYSGMSVTGTYEVTSDNRGTLKLETPLGPFTYKLALNATGSDGRLISFDNSGVRGSGVLKLQKPADFNPSAFANGYVMALSGEDGFGGRISALGLIFPDGSSFVSGSSLDINDAGSVFSTYAPGGGSTSFSGYYSVDFNGRGTISLTVPGVGGGILDFAFYIVSDQEFFLVSTDPVYANNMIVAGPAELQNSQLYDATSLNAASVFGLTGTSGFAPQDIVGKFAFDGISQVAVNFDENSAGTMTVGGTMTGSYSMQPNGRATLTLNSPQGTLIWNLYATGPNQGFVMDGMSTAASVGPVFAQESGPFSNSDMLGSYVLGPDDPVVQTSTLNSGVASFSGGSDLNGNGGVSGAEDISSLSSLTPDQVLAGTYNVSVVSNNGRGAILLTSPASDNIAIWVASPSQVLGLDLSSGNKQPVILHLNQ